MDVIIDRKVKGVKEDLVEKMEVDKRKLNLILRGVKESVANPDDSVDNDLTLDQKDMLTAKEILKLGLNMDGDRHIEGIQRIDRAKADKIRPDRSVSRLGRQRVKWIY